MSRRYGGRVRVDRRVSRATAAPLTSAPTPDRGRPGHHLRQTRLDRAEIGGRLVRITRARLECPDHPHPLADLTILYALQHVVLRDAVIATLMGSGAGPDLAHQRATDMTWLTIAGDRSQLARAHRLLDHLEALTNHREHGELVDVVHSIRALLHWSGNRPLQAQQALHGVRSPHPLADVVRQSLRIGHSPTARTASETCAVPTPTEDVQHG